MAFLIKHAVDEAGDGIGFGDRQWSTRRGRTDRHGLGCIGPGCRAVETQQRGDQFGGQGSLLHTRLLKGKEFLPPGDKDSGIPDERFHGVERLRQAGSLQGLSGIQVTLDAQQADVAVNGGHLIPG